LHLFVYGSLMRGQSNHDQLAAGRYLGEAATAPGYALVDLGPYPAMLRTGTGRVHGELYEIDDVLLARLDEFEDVHGPYRRRRIELADGSVADAYMSADDHVNGPIVASGDWRRR
jgi:gamma-glutamylcyclotransferase (GGCT)/AIG2-like uncharacterized protein YtfP